MTVAEIIDRYRKSKNLLNKELADELGVNRVVFSRIKNGRAPVPVLKAVKWAEIFGCEPGDLNPKLK